METVRFAVIGFGNIGKRHAALVDAHEHGLLAAIVDTDVQACTEAVETYNVPVFESVEAFLAADVTCDVVNICSPNYLHIPQTIAALESNYHVVCEKPFGLKSIDCQQAIETAKAKDKHLFCVMQNRYSPPSKWLKSLMDEDRLGKIFYVQINCFWNRDERYYTPGGWRGTKDKDGGVLYTQFSHFVDTLYWLFGDIENISANIHNHNHPSIEIEDTGSISFDLKNGGSGSFNYTTCCYDKNLESSITIIAEKGQVKVSGQYMERIETCHIANYTTPQLESPNPPNQYAGYTGSAANHAYVINNVIETLNDQAAPHVSAQEGAKVVGMIEEVYSS